VTRPRRSFAPLAALCGAIVFSVCACSFVGRQAFAPPVVVVNDARLIPLRARLELVLSIYNPNNYRLDAEALHYRAYVDTLMLGEGAIDNRLTIRAKDSVLVNVPVSVKVGPLLIATALVGQRGTVDFTLAGDVRVLTVFGGVSRAFEQKGTYDGVTVTLLPPKGR
jgi:LEA14-like dessication related protein